MNFVSFQRVLLYCCAAVLVIANGQSTTDNNIDTFDIEMLRAELANSVARIAKLEANLAVAVRKIAQLTGK